jgi:hypothetical protein
MEVSVRLKRQPGKSRNIGSNPSMPPSLTWLATAVRHPELWKFQAETDKLLKAL